jgi:nitrate reductase NapAB chaperone NapD
MGQNEVQILKIMTLKYTKLQIWYKLIILVQISSLQLVILKMNSIYVVHNVTNAVFVYSWSHTQVTILASLYAAAAVILTEFICDGH